MNLHFLRDAVISALVIRASKIGLASQIAMPGKFNGILTVFSFGKIIRKCSNHISKSMLLTEFRLPLKLLINFQTFVESQTKSN